MDTQHTKTENKCKVSPWKAFFKAFIVSGLLTLAAKSYNTIVETQDRIWQEYQSPFDTKSEYFKLNWLKKTRILLSEAGLDRSNLIQKWLANYSEYLFLQAKSKIPNNDPLLLDYLDMHKYTPLMYMEPIIITPDEQKELVIFMTKLLDSKSSKTNFSKTVRFALINSTIHWFMYHAPKDISLSSGIQIRDMTHESIHQINFHDFQTSKFIYYIPFSLYVKTLQIDLAYLELMHCNKNAVNAVKCDLERLSELTKFYKSRPSVEENKQAFLSDAWLSDNLILKSKLRIDQCKKSAE